MRHSGTGSQAVTTAGIERGTPAFRRTNLALFLAGFVSFALLYFVQPLLPVFTVEFGIQPATSSLALSVATFSLAVAMLIASSLSEALGRKPVMVASLAACALFTVLCALSPDWTTFVLLRALVGIAMSGAPAIAMAYASEEFAPRAVSVAMGLLVAGNAVGGMSGRLAAGLLADVAPWRWVVAGMGIVALALALAFWRALPPSQHFERRPLAFASLTSSLRDHVRDPALAILFAEAALLMGAFVTVYNYATFRLLGAPFDLSQAAASAVFGAYVMGIVASPTAGALTALIGRRRLLWLSIGLMLAGILATLSSMLWLFVAGMLAMTCGFFGAHTVASTWVGQRALKARAQASALYLFLYYAGSSVAGTAGGLFFAAFGWPGVVTFTATLVAAALALALRLSRITRESPTAAAPQ